MALARGPVAHGHFCSATYLQHGPYGGDRFGQLPLVSIDLIGGPTTPISDRFARFETCLTAKGGTVIEKGEFGGPSSAGAGRLSLAAGFPVVTTLTRIYPSAQLQACRKCASLRFCFQANVDAPYSFLITAKAPEREYTALGPVLEHALNTLTTYDRASRPKETTPVR